MRVLGKGQAAEEASAMQAGWRRRCVAATVLLASMVLPASAAAAHDPAAGPLRIPLEPMGYQTLSQEFLLAGSSMLTVDFVDKDHLLITFGVRRLMKREANDPVDDADRTIGAFLVELASGKVLARTEWRVHDRGQYLWNLGRGRFLLRVRDRLTMFAPLASPDPADAFREVPLLRVERHVVAVLVSPDCDLLTVETTKWAMGSGEATEGFSADPAPVQINFYRLIDTADGLVASEAGTIRTRTAVALPLTTAGLLDVLEGGKNHWLFNFNEHTGKVDELAEFDTSCFPRPTFVGHSEFVAFGCRGDRDKLDFAGFNLKGEAMWQQNFYESYVNPTFAFAPEAGRFALERTLVNGPFDPEMPLLAAFVTAEEVRVYQSYDGKQLFKIDCSPVERAGQNFALSPDGMKLAVVRELQVRHPSTKDTPAYTQGEVGVEVYALPALSKEDQAAVKDAQDHAPVDTGVRIDVALQRTAGRPAKDAPVPDPAPEAEAQTAPAAEPKNPAADAGPAPDAGTVTEGDVQPAGPRKPPTLYGPDDKQPASKPQ
jgi:hypothetical protein